MTKAIDAGKAQVRIGAKSTLKRDLSKAMSEVKNFSRGVGMAMKGIGKSLKLAGLAGGVGAAGASFLVKLGGDAEAAQLKFKNLTGSMDEAKKVLEQLNSFADSTPFSNDDIQKTGQILLTNGTAVANLNSEMRTLATLAAKAGSTTQELALILQDIRGKGKIDTQDIRQFASRGINLRGALGDHLGLGQGELQARISSPLGQGSISPQQVEAALAKIASDSPKLLDDLGNSFNGMLSTMLGQLRSVGREFGQIIINDFNLKELMAESIEWIKNNRKELTEGFREGALHTKAFAVNFKSWTEGIVKSASKFEESGLHKFMMEHSSIYKHLAGQVKEAAEGHRGLTEALRMERAALERFQATKDAADPFKELERSRAIAAETRKMGLYSIDDIMKLNKAAGAASLGVSSESIKGSVAGMLGGLRGKAAFHGDGLAGAINSAAITAGNFFGGLNSIARSVAPQIQAANQRVGGATRGTMSGFAASRFFSQSQTQTPALSLQTEQRDLMKDIKEKLETFADKIGIG